MKKLTFLLLGLLTLAVTSCGSDSTKYSGQTCDILIQKYNKDGELTKKEMRQALDQLGGIIDEMDVEVSKIIEMSKKDKSKAKTMFEDMRNATLLKHYNGIQRIVYGYEKYLEEDAPKKLEEVKKKDDEINKKGEEMARSISWGVY